jgi:predicted ribonuclease YlaK
MLIFFVDTNFFLQCRDPRQLPWADVADGNDVVVLIPRTVQKEVDQKKQGGNSRRAKRARKASSLFREVLGALELRKVVREAGPRVELSFPPPPDPNRERLPQLDLEPA